MAQQQSGYACPMHNDIRQATVGKCPKCGMDLAPENAEFPMLRHVTSNPWMLMTMAAAMLAIMTVLMIL